MKQLLELLPIAAFLIAYLLFKDIYIATQFLIVGTALQLLTLKLKGHKITPMQWGTAIVTTLFGSLTLLFHDETFVKIKPTIIYLASAAGFFMSNYFFKKNLVKAALGMALNPPESTWAKLNTIWIILFLVMAAANTALAYTVTTEVWAWSKLFFAGVTMVFIGVQLYVLRAYLIQQPTIKQPD
jgi:intracellular septation protein